jgi:carboxymethylenebutenolidase
MYEGMLAEHIRLAGHNGDDIDAFSARPLGDGPFPGVVVLHEIFGLVEHIKEVTQKFAHHSYIAVAPDLYTREGPGDPEDVAARVRAGGGNPDDRCIGDVAGTIAQIRRMPNHNGKIGVIGFCSGGRQTYLVACSLSGIDAAVDCYGGRVVAKPEELNALQPRSPFELTANLTAPLLGLFGQEDANPSPEQVAQIEGELMRLGKTYEFHTYPNAGHAFFADYRPSYRQEASLDGWQRVWDWFGKYLH